MPHMSNLPWTTLFFYIFFAILIFYIWTNMSADHPSQIMKPKNDNK